MLGWLLEKRQSSSAAVVGKDFPRKVHRGVAKHGVGVERSAEALARAVVAGRKRLGLPPEVHDGCVVDDLAGEAEAVLPRHVDKDFLVALLHVVHGVLTVFAHGLEALHGSHGADGLAEMAAVVYVEEVLEHAHLFKRLAALFDEHADGGLAFAEYGIVNARALGEADTSH